MKKKISLIIFALIIFGVGITFVNAQENIEAPTITLKYTTYNAIRIDADRNMFDLILEVYRFDPLEDDFIKIDQTDIYYYIDSDVIMNQQYYYKARICLESDPSTCSDYSNIIEASAKLIKPTFKLNEPGYDSVAITIDDPGINLDYEIYRSTNNIDFILFKDVSIRANNDMGLIANKMYYYKLRSYITIEGVKYYSEYSDILSAKTFLDYPRFSISNVTYNSAGITINHAAGATGCEIWQSTDNKKWEKLTTTTGTAYTVTGLVPNTKYYYKTRAYVTYEGETTYGNYSYVESITPKLQTPTIKAAFTYNTNKLTINKVAGATGYEIYRSTDNKTYKKIATTTALTYTDKSLKIKTKYYYKVRPYIVVNGKKVYGDYSKIINSTPKIAVPSYKLENIYTINKITITKVNDASGYEIYRSTKATTGFKLLKRQTALTYTDNTVKVGTKYYYKVRAYRTINGKRVYSSWSTITNKTVALPKPKITKSLSAYNVVKLTITKVANTTGYEIYKSTDNKTFKKIATTTALTYTDKSLATNKTFYYKVRPYKVISGKKVYGKYSAVVSQKTSTKAVYSKDKLLVMLKKDGFICDKWETCRKSWSYESVYYDEIYNVKEKLYYLGMYFADYGFSAHGYYHINDKMSYAYLYQNLTEIWASYNPTTKMYGYFDYYDYTYHYEEWDAAADIAYTTYIIFNEYLKEAGIKESDLK